MADPLVQGANETIQELEGKIQEFFQTVNDVLSWVPGAFADLIEPIQRGMEALRKKIQEFWERVEQWQREPGDATALRAKASDWIQNVAEPLGAITGNIGLINLKANAEWTGPAAEAYKALVPAQAEGLSSVKGLALQNQLSLNSLADALDAFYLAMKVAGTVFIAGAVGAIAGACTVVCTPGAIAALATAASVSIGLITTAIIAMNSFMDAIETQQRALTQKINEVGDTWKRSSHELSDGSVSDGDRTEWRATE